jgi:pimeloyl-ACP methyl ester carboxylesterase
VGTGFVDGFAALLHTRPAQRALLALASQNSFTPEVLDAYYASLLTNKAVRHDLARFLQKVDQRDMLQVTRRFAQVTQPVHLVWGQNDMIFPVRLARRLQRALPYATLQLVPGSRAFVPEDQPAVLARAIAAFVEEPVAHAEPAEA